MKQQNDATHKTGVRSIDLMRGTNSVQFCYGDGHVILPPRVRRALGGSGELPSVELRTAKHFDTGR